MVEPIINIEALGKRYLLGAAQNKRYATLRDRITALFRNQSLRLKNQEAFWALKDVSFQVQPGEVIGIIGRNGAGKSTLLKLLSRITEPTKGRITLRGRVASLLEVGTGFHPELTGRENIYLNGALLGMKRAEINTKFDEIVAFAEVDKFLDTPVKRYSSGMYVRLAFAVAAHLDPEILVVDEVLAVGDAQFQAKCLGKMQDVAQHSGRTILFVSHNLASVRQLTNRCIMLAGGRVAFDGPTDAAIDFYLTQSRAGGEDADVTSRPRLLACSETMRFTRLSLANNQTAMPAGEPLMIEAVIEFKEAIRGARISLTVFTAEGATVGSGFSDCIISRERLGLCVATIRLPVQNLAPGSYDCSIALSVPSSGVPLMLDALDHVLPFELTPSAIRDSEVTEWHRNWGALRLPKLEVELSA